MKEVIEEQTELSESIKSILPNIDFSDTFSTTNYTNSIEEIVQLIFNTTPTWIKYLFAIRNQIVKVFGLRTKMPDDYNDNFKVGGYVGFFKIFSIKEYEVVLGANDSHLNFRAIVSNDRTEQYNIKVITLVEYNNLTGKIYMNLIKPFHRLVVKRMVRNAYLKN